MESAGRPGPRRARGPSLARRPPASAADRRGRRLDLRRPAAHTAPVPPLPARPPVCLLPCLPACLPRWPAGLPAVALGRRLLRLLRLLRRLCAAPRWRAGHMMTSSKAQRRRADAVVDVDPRRRRRRRRRRRLPGRRGGWCASYRTPGGMVMQAEGGEETPVCRRRAGGGICHSWTRTGQRSAPRRAPSPARRGRESRQLTRQTTVL